MSDLGPIQAVADAFCGLLRTIPGLTVREEWPYANEQLKYPTVTVTQGNLTRTPLMPNVDSQSAPDKNNLVTANLVIAEYDATFQLDVWTRNKLERAQVVKSILDLFRANEVTTDTTGVTHPYGINLTLANYYNVIASLEVESHQTVDDEASAQRQERRATIMVLVNVSEVAQRKYYGIRSIQVDTAVAESDQALNNPTETGTIF